MQAKKYLKSKSYQEFLISRLKKPAHAAGYIEAILEEKNPEPQLLISALENVIDAQIGTGQLSEAAKQHYEKLNEILSRSGGAEIYALVGFLEAIGLQFAVTAQVEE